jgi:hypothetical protein
VNPGYFSSGIVVFAVVFAVGSGFVGGLVFVGGSLRRLLVFWTTLATPF